MDRWMRLCAIIFAIVTIFMEPATAQEAAKTAKSKSTMPAEPFPGKKPKAPSLDGGNGWLNTDKPISLDALKGKIVLLDFWTFCCINCMQILPDLTKLEEEFANELVVVGVHSAKFSNEQDTDNIRNAVARYNIRHPVVNDSEMKIWRTYGARAWPTLVLIDPEGFVIGSVSGEGNYELLRTAIGKLVAYHKVKGTLDGKPKKFALEIDKLKKTPLLYPGKVVVDPKVDRMFIADSGHNRVIVANASAGKVDHVIGSGKMGLRDGDFVACEFDDPQGIAFAGDILYVADRRNHAIRRIDLANKTVKTVAGTGKQGYGRSANGPGTKVDLASPWDVLLVGSDLYIAMAGLHQIWKLDTASGIVAPFAGSGREDIINGTRAEAALAQPSGLATDGTHLFVADSEVSAIRAIGINKDVVKSLVGEGLFVFGDQDGSAARVRLQHALGVAYDAGKLYVADTYNNKIKVLNAETGEAATLFGDGWAGSRDAPARFDHPGGIAFAGGKLYVADTNNHAIRVIDLEAKTVKTLTLRF